MSFDHCVLLSGKLNPILGGRIFVTLLVLGIRRFASDLCFSGLSSRYSRQALSKSTPLPFLGLAVLIVVIGVLSGLGFVLKFPVKNLPCEEVKVKYFMFDFLYIKYSVLHRSSSKTGAICSGCLRIVCRRVGDERRVRT